MTQYEFDDFSFDDPQPNDPATGDDFNFDDPPVFDSPPPHKPKREPERAHSPERARALQRNRQRPDSTFDFQGPPKSMSVAELIRATWRIFSQHWARWLGVILLAVLPMMLMWFIMYRMMQSPMMVEIMQMSAYSSYDDTLSPAQAEALLGSMGMFFAVTCGLGLLVAIYETLIVLGLGTALASADFLEKKQSFDEALTIALSKRSLPLLGGIFVVGLAVSLLYMVAGLLTMVCVGVVLLPLVLYMAVVWTPLLAPVLVLERGPFMRLLARAWYFGKKRIWLTLSVWILLWLGSFVIAMISMVGYIPMFSDPAFMLDPSGYPPPDMIYSPLNMAVSGLSAVVQLVFGVFVIIFFTIVYHDAQACHDPRGATAAIAAGNPPAPPESAFTGQDVMNMIIMTVVMGVVLCVMMVIVMALMMTIMIPLMENIDPEMMEVLIATMEARPSY